MQPSSLYCARYEGNVIDMQEMHHPSPFLVLEMQEIRPSPLFIVLDMQEMQPPSIFCARYKENVAFFSLLC
jgi:hypothetical protein